MADSNINSMPASTPLAGTEIAMVVTSNTTSRTTTDGIRLLGGNFTAQALGAAKTEIGAVGPAGEAGTRWGPGGATVTYRDVTAGGVSVDVLGVKQITFKNIGGTNVCFGINNIPAGTSGSNNVAAGNNALSALGSGTSNTAAGFNAAKNVTGIGGTITAAGSSTASGVTTGTFATVVGKGADVSGGGAAATAVGKNAVAGPSALAIGFGTSATGAGSAAIGTSAAGVGATTSTANQIVLGAPAHTVTIPGKLTTIAGAASGGTQVAKVGGTLFSSFADNGNAAGSVETDLVTNTLVGNTLGVNGDKIIATYCGNTVNNANTKQLRVYFGGTLILDTGALNDTGSAPFDVSVEVMRESATVVRCLVRYLSANMSSPIVTNYARVTALTLSASNILKITGTATALNDVFVAMSRVQWFPAG